jgi:AbrB family looped-hinge helix DNA binding protein
MSKITGKFQITLPKRLVDQYGIKIGDEVELTASGDAISLIAKRRTGASASSQQQVHHFDLATQRQRTRERARPLAPAKRRGWKREDLYIRGGTH